VPVPVPPPPPTDAPPCSQVCQGGGVTYIGPGSGYTGDQCEAGELCCDGSGGILVCVDDNGVSGPHCCCAGEVRDPNNDTCPVGACCHCRYAYGSTILNDPALVIQQCEEWTGDPRFWDPAQECGSCQADQVYPGWYRWRIAVYTSPDNGQTWRKFCTDITEGECAPFPDSEWFAPPLTCNTPGLPCTDRVT